MVYEVGAGTKDVAAHTGHAYQVSRVREHDVQAVVDGAVDELHSGGWVVGGVRFRTDERLCESCCRTAIELYEDSGRCPRPVDDHPHRTQLEVAVGEHTSHAAAVDGCQTANRVREEVAEGERTRVRNGVGPAARSTAMGCESS